MEAKDSLVKVLKALIEIKSPMGKQPLTDLLMGKETTQAQEEHWDDLESYGSGDQHDEDYWTMVLEGAIKQNYLKCKPAKSDTYVPSPAGKKFLKNPTSFEVSEEDEFSSSAVDELGSGDPAIDEMVLNAMRMAHQSNTSTKTKNQIKLIQAVDRKIALDDFAESESMALDDVLDEVEYMIDHQGKKLDIKYFTDEVLGQECMDELLDYFDDAPNDNLEAAIKEMGDVYNPEELRLARIVYRVNKMK